MKALTRGIICWIIRWICTDLLYFFPAYIRSYKYCFAIFNKINYITLLFFMILRVTYQPIAMFFVYTFIDIVNSL